MATAERSATVSSVGSLLVVDLGELRAADLPRVGGKAANLGELISAGLPVPGGFCVTTEAYARAAADVDTSDPARAREQLRSVPVPDDIAAAVTAAYRALGDGVPVAVRSSATAEDLPTASFAGQQDTYLNVVGVEALLDAVRRCWASLWTDRAVAYRTDVGVDHAEVQLAVVVQRMVDAQVAGVLFTADPVSGRRTRLVLDASPGLGEAVVSGMVNPDHLAVEHGRVVERRLGDKTVAVRALPGGGTERVALTTATPARPSAEACVTDAQAVALAALGRRVEQHFGVPQDIEWAIDGSGALWLTQSRPITTLYPLPERRAAGNRAYFCVTLAQGLVRPITPMGMSAFRVIASTAAGEVFGAPVADPLVGPTALQDLGGRAFVDVTVALRSPVGRAVLPRVLDLMEARTAVVLRALLEDPDFSVRGSRLTFARKALRALARFRMPPVAALAMARPAAARRYLARLQRPAQDLAPLPAGAPAGQRLDRVEWALSLTFPAVPRMFPVWLPGLLLLRAAQAVAGGALDPALADEVLRSLPHNVTSLMDLELWALATRVRGDAESAGTLSGTPAAELAQRYLRGTLPRTLQEGLAGFLARHGHRAVAAIVLGLPRWSDDPRYVLGVLANYLRLDDPELAPDAQFTRGARAAEATIARVVAGVRRRSAPRAALLAWMLRRVRQLAGMRETHKDYLVRILAYARHELGVVGAELVERGQLATADDVYFLDLREVRSGAVGNGPDLRALVERRRADYRLELRRRHVPRILLSDGTEPEALVAAHAGAAPGDLVGTPASAGTATAPARVVLDPVGAHLEPGEILVAPSTDPGWTPLFLTAGGLVMEMGGPNSHGAVVAREYGIPAVVGVADAPSRLRTGELVTVDGAAGLVHTAATAI
jgi:pyruvate,water dikinase